RKGSSFPAMTIEMDQAEQPDFGRIQQSFVALGDQFALCANIPAATEGVSISRQLETITVSIREISARVQQVDARVQQVDARVQQVDARVSQLDIRLDGHMNQINTRMAAEAANRLYCNENKAATVPDSGLQPLLDVQTGQPIEGFPETLGAIDALNDTPSSHNQDQPTRPSSPSPLDGVYDLEPLPEPLSGPSTHATTSNALTHSIASSSSSSPFAATGPSSGPIIEMEPMTGAGHRRRRSSLMQSVGASTPDRAARPRAQSLRTPGARAPGGLAEEPKISEEAPDAFPSASADPADDSFSDEDLHDDEETGLTKKDKRRKRQKKRRNTLLDQRIARGGDITAEEKKEADHNVVRNLAINASLILLWYIFSLSISLYNKWMFDKDRLNFAFPLFTTSCHMLVQFALSGLVLYFIPSLRPHNAQHNSDAGRSRHETEPDRPLMSKLFYLTRIGPCGAATGLDIGLGNTSLKFITLTFYTMCKSSSLAFVLIFAFIFRLEKPTWRLVAIIATMTAGVVLMVSGEVEFKLGGFVLVISAAFFSGFRWALTQILLLRNPATSNPFSSIFFLAPVMFVVLMAIAIPVEGFPALT
ncbi:hypothetical protein BN1723_003492, partial [Verticillium longisporum]